MKRLLVVLLGCVALFAAAPGQAQARECDLPNKTPLWIDFADGSVPYWQMFAQPGVIAAAANFIFPPQIRALGAKTVYWEMNLRERVGTPANPRDPKVVQDWADRVFYRAVASSACATPWIALNEMWGSNLADAVVAHEHPVPPERDHLRQAPAGARCAPVPAPLHAAVHGRGGRRLVARGFAVHRLRARDLLQRATAPWAGRDSGITDAAQRVPPGRDRPDRHRDPALEDRHLPRLPHEPGSGRPREAEAGSAPGSTPSSGRCSRSGR